MARRASSTISTSTMRMPTAEPDRESAIYIESTGDPTMSYDNPPPFLANPRPSTTTRWPKSGARQRPASMISAAAARNASCRISTICCFSARRSRAIRWKAIARDAAPMSCSARASPRSRSHLKIPITIAGMSFGSLSANAKEALGRAATARRHLDHDRRWRHDAGRARPFADAGLSVSAVALRHEPGRSAQGRRHRGRHRPGRQARRRRHAARPEDLRPRRGDAHAAEGHRSALGLPPSRLDRAGRSRDQDPRVARDHRLGKADLS